VARLKFVQGAFVPPAPAPRLRKPAQSLRETDPANAYAGPDNLKAALQHLARWRESGKN
jgi:hypothetical protein